MYKEIESAVNDFLIAYGIRGLGIFRDWVLLQSAVNSSHGQSCRFLIDDDDIISFRCESLTKAEIENVILFLNSFHEKNVFASLEANANTFETKTVDIPLSEAVIIKHLLPSFKVYIETIFKNSPDQLKVYQIQSADELEEENIRLAKELFAELTNLVIKDSPDLRESLHAIGKLFHSYSPLTVSENGEEYQTIFSIRQQLNAWSEIHKETAQAIPYQQLIKKITLALDNFEKFAHPEKRKEVQAFFEKLDQFLQEFKITASKCSIFENTLLKMAGANIKFDSAEMDSRMSRIYFHYNFSLLQFKEEEIRKLINFFKLNGDETIYLEPKEIAERGKEVPHVTNFQNGIEDTSHPDNYNVYNVKETKVFIHFDVDGCNLANHIFNEFKQLIRTLAKDDPEYLAPYQAQCADYFLEKELSEVIHLFKIKHPEKNLLALLNMFKQKSENINIENANDPTITLSHSQP